MKWTDGKAIKMKQATDVLGNLGFAYYSIYTGAWLEDATAIEKACQTHFNYFPLGERLWRCVAKAAKRTDETAPIRIYQVFVTFPYDLPVTICVVP